MVCYMLCYVTLYYVGSKAAYCMISFSIQSVAQNTHALRDDVPGGPPSPGLGHERNLLQNPAEWRPSP